MGAEFLTRLEWVKLLDALMEAGLVEVYGAIVAMNREVELRREEIELLERLVVGQQKVDKAWCWVCGAAHILECTCIARPTAAMTPEQRACWGTNCSTSGRCLSCGADHNTAVK